MIDPPPASRIGWVAARAEDRLARVVAELARLPASAEALLVGPTREAADELGRRVARSRGGASFGLSRSTPSRLALDLAGPALARRGLAPAEPGAREALARRALEGALRDRALGAVRAGDAAATAAVRSPSFPRAVAATLDELRLAGVAPAALRARGEALRARSAHEAARAASLDDLAELAERYLVELTNSQVADRKLVLEAATAALAAGARLPGLVAWVDVAVPSAAEAAFAAAIAERASRFVATIPRGDDAAQAFAAAAGVEVVAADAERSGALAAVQRDLFAASPRGAADDGAVTWIAAPGETREAVEVARRVLAASRLGVPFDAIAVVVRSREVHGAAIEAALGRSGVPSWFESGTRRPHPAGRALLALLACRREGLSARRFAEFLSIGEAGRAGEDEDGLDGASRWERLLREAAVIGGRDRWERRLQGLVAEKRGAARADATDAEARLAALSRDEAALTSLRAFALPIVDALAELPTEAPLTTWVDRLAALATLSLREPAPVLEALVELRAIGGEASARLVDVESALEPVLRWLERPRPARRHGRVLVTTPEGLRGRTVHTVIVPGLAERLFPAPFREDPLLADEDREALSPSLACRKDRSGRERLQLALAVGAAEGHLVVSWPRTESETGRPRVPSLYALEVLRARDGALPDLARLGREARRAGGRIAWPAPREPADAIDEAEHDLAVLGSLLSSADAEQVRGRARYLLEENEHLGRALRARYARWQVRGLGPWDGARIGSPTARALVAASRPTVRALAPSTLRHFAACPYRFFLHGVVGLRATAEPEAVERLDPRTRGDLLHRALAELAVQLEARGWTTLSPEVLGDARLMARRITREVGAAAKDELAPRVPRVFDDEIEELASDVEAWVLFASREAAEGRWVPHRFDLAFGLSRAGHLDPRSSEAPAQVGPFLLRGAIDAVERHAVTGELRVTDYKTGADDLPRQFVVHGGEVLQPVLYAMALEAHAEALATAGPVGGARLLYASARGGFRDRSVPLDPGSRRAGLAVLEAVDAALGRGVLPALPREGACAGCDFRPLCGPDEERRARSKDDRRDAVVRDELAHVRGLR